MDQAAPSAWFSNLPVRLTRIVGRDAVIEQLDRMLDDRRLLSVVGPGGIGKSTVALAVAERRAEHGSHDTHFIDLSLTYDAASVDAQLVSALQLDPKMVAGREAIVDQLLGADALLLLDNCEHVIGEIARLAELVGGRAPNVRMLATSREPLGIPGEKVYRLASLAVPPRDEEALSIEEALEFPAAQLFSERAASTGFVLGEGDVDAVIDICHRLDGIPLALELAASRVALFGTRELSARLDDRFELLVGARRTAVPRQQTLLATLDWSFSALTPEEQHVLTCLGIFRSAFSLQEALGLLQPQDLSQGQCIQVITSLVTKSLLTAVSGRDGAAYRLLETTRHYAMQKLEASPFVRQVRLAHVQVCASLLAGAKRDMLLLDRTLWMQRYGSIIVDLQAALQWAGSDDGDRAAGIALASAAAPLIEQLLLSPTHFLPLTPDSDEASLRMSLPLAHMRGHVQGDVRQMSGYAELADRRQKELGIVLPEVLAAQFGAALVSGDYHQALHLSRAVGEMGAERDEPELVMLGRRVAAQAHYYLGHIEDAKRCAAEVLASPYEFLPHSVNSHRVSMRVILARSAVFEDDLNTARGWLDELVDLARQETPITLCFALAIGAVPVAVWLDDEDMARKLLSDAIRVADRHALQFWKLTTADLARGIEHVWGQPPFASEEPGLEDAIGATGVDTLPTFAPSLLTARALERVTASAVGWNAAEILRVNAVTSDEHDPRRARRMLAAAAKLARRYGARFWENRIMLSLRELPPETSTFHHDAAP